MKRINVSPGNINIGHRLRHNGINFEGGDLVLYRRNHLLVAWLNRVFESSLKRFYTTLSHDRSLRIRHSLISVGQPFAERGHRVSGHILEDIQQISLRQSLCRLTFHLPMTWYINNVLDVRDLGHCRSTLGLIRAMIEWPKWHLG